MDKSYRLKLEKWLSEKTLNQQILVACVSKFENKSAKLAYDCKKYENSPYDLGYKYKEAELQKLIDYKAPFINALRWDFHLTLDQIKHEVADTLQNPKLSKNIPDYATIDVVRNLLLGGEYTV